MAELPPPVGTDADTALLDRARAGDSDAFGELYSREVDAARRLARILVGEQGADELASESFARVLAQLQAGRGPTADFRAYLHVTIRNGFRDGLRATKESPASDQAWLLDDVLPSVEELVEDLDREVAVTALATLPRSWQQVLWHLEVEGRKPAEVATILDLDARAVSSLAYRAREGLKRAYLDQHLRPASGGQCGWTQRRMSQYVRDDLSPRARQKVADHLDECETCSAALLAVDRVNQKLAAWLFPVVLWGLASADKGGLWWLAGTGAGGASVAGGAGGSGTSASGPSGPGRRATSNPVVVGAAAAVVAALVGAGALTLLVTDDDDKPHRSVSAGGSAPHLGDAAPPGGSKQPKDQDPSADALTEVPVLEQPIGAPPIGAPPIEAPPIEAPPTSIPPSGEAPVDVPSGTGEPPTQPQRAPHLARLDARSDGVPVVGPWKMGVIVAAQGSAPISLRVVYRFAELALLLGRSGVGWRCDGVISALNPFDGPVACTYRYAGGAVPPVVLTIVALVPDPRSGPAGKVRLYADGKLVDSGSF